MHNSMTFLNMHIISIQLQRGKWDIKHLNKPLFICTHPLDTNTHSVNWLSRFKREAKTVKIFPVLFVFSFMEARGSFPPFYSAPKLIFPKLLPWKDYFYSYYHKLLNMHKLLFNLFNISNTNCIKVSNITLGKYTLHICNIINLTVCGKKTTFGKQNTSEISFQ